MNSSRRLALAVCAGLSACLGAGSLIAATGAAEHGAAQAGANPCKEHKRKLRCPDLRMRPPFDIHRDKVGGKPVLRAANSIDSVGEGPAELRGRRSGPREMNAHQQVRTRGGGWASFNTGAELYFKSIPGQGRYWKFRDAAHMSLWLLDGDGDRVRRVEVGPKQVYCLRDLFHTHPGISGSPDHRHYPSCSQDASRRRVTLGTSVGWSDVYPYTYHQQYVELNHIPKRGCYAYVHVADPDDGLNENRERNNAASTVVFLTPAGRYKPRRCRGVRDRALPARQTTDDSQVHSGGGGGGGGGGYRPRP
jgi:hypothetical protein